MDGGIIFERCCGLDVHKLTVVATVLVVEGGATRSTTKTFGTTTKDLLELSDWLAEEKVTHVAMEATGVLWKPVWNILESRCIVLLDNPGRLAKVPGRKTDVTDSQWIAHLLQVGHLHGSFIPPLEIRELRDLTRQRVQLLNDRTSAINRLHKILQDANIKLSSVASDIMGVSGRAMIKAMIAGENDPKTLAELARQRLRGKIPQLRQVLHGHISDHHRFMLNFHMDQIESLEGLIERLESRMDEACRPLGREIRLLMTIPGVSLRSAQSILAEIGADMSRFASARNLASWAGICPGNNSSANVKKRGRILMGNHWLKRVLAECAWAAARNNDGYLRAQFKRFAPRKGKKRAIIAVAHSILIAIHHMLSEGVPFIDLGADYFDQTNKPQLIRYHTKRLEQLGLKVTLESAASA